MQVEFDWNPVKAASNLAKHGVSFQDAMTVFADPLALSRLDENHGATEERWVTMGEAAVGFCWRFTPMWSWAEGRVFVRIISANVPGRREARQYQEGVTR